MYTRLQRSLDSVVLNIENIVIYINFARFYKSEDRRIAEFALSGI